MARAQAEVIPNRPAPALQSFSRNDTIRPNRNAPLPGFPVREKEANHEHEYRTRAPCRSACHHGCCKRRGRLSDPVGDPHASEYLPCHYTSDLVLRVPRRELQLRGHPHRERPEWADGRYFVQAEKEIAGPRSSCSAWGTRRAHRGGILRKCPE